MMARWFWLVLVMTGMMAGAAQARPVTPPPEVVAAVQALIVDGWLPTQGDDVDSDAPRPPKATARAVRMWRRSGLLKVVNVTPGRAADWLIDTEKTAYPAAWCGTGGCLIEIWSRGDDGRYRKVFRSQIREYHVRPIAGRRFGWLEVDFHGSVCGLTGVEACPWGFEWRDDGLGTPAMRASLRFVREPLLHAGSTPQALDGEDGPQGDVPPAAVAAVVAEQTSRCGALGAGIETRGLASRVPDMNGDGIDDWSYDGVYLTCDFGTEAPPADLADVDWCTKVDCGWRLWLSRRSGSGVDWQAADLDPNGLYALSLRPGALPGVVQLSNRPGVKDDDDDACVTYFVEHCVQTPISLSPKR